MKEVLEQAIKNILKKYKNTSLLSEWVRDKITKEITQDIEQSFTITTKEKINKEEIVSYSEKDTDVTVFDDDWETDEPSSWENTR